MIRCPECKLYMSSHVVNIFGGVRTIWTCCCGYTTEQENTSLSTSTSVSSKLNNITDTTEIHNN